MNNRQILLETALELFSERGYAGCGVQEICERAGVSKPTLYHYFGSKLGLLEGLLESRHPALAEAVAAAAQGTHDLPRDLERVMRAFFSFAGANPRYYRLLLTLWFSPPESEAHQAMRRRMEAQTAALEALFREAAEDHGNMGGRSVYFAAAFLGLIHTCIGLHLNGVADLDEELLRQALRQFQYGIYS